MNGTGKTRREVAARRTVALGAAMATVAAGVATAGTGAADGASAPERVWLAQAAGGEGEGAVTLAPDLALLRDLGLLDGQLRIGIALVSAGDPVAAAGFQGPELVDRIAAVAGPVEARGLVRLSGDLALLADAASKGAPVTETASLAEVVLAALDEARATTTPRDQLLALAEITRAAAGEYQVATGDGAVIALDKYRESLGFLMAVAAQADGLAASPDPAVAEAAQKVQGQVALAETVYGGLDGPGDAGIDASLLYGAAARMELAALRVEP